MRLAAKARRQQDTPAAAVKGPLPEVNLLTASKTLFYLGESDVYWDQYRVPLSASLLSAALCIPLLSFQARKSQVWPTCKQSNGEPKNRYRLSPTFDPMGIRRAAATTTLFHRFAGSAHFRFFPIRKGGQGSGSIRTWRRRGR